MAVKPRSVMTRRMLSASAVRLNSARTLSSLLIKNALWPIQGLSRSVSRLGQKTKVADLVVDLLLHDQIVLHIHRDLDVAANGNPAGGMHRPGIYLGR